MRDYLIELRSLSSALKSHPALRTTISPEIFDDLAIELQRLYTLVDEQKATIQLLEQVAKY